MSTIYPLSTFSMNEPLSLDAARRTLEEELKAADRGVQKPSREEIETEKFNQRLQMMVASGTSSEARIA